MNKKSLLKMNGTARAGLQIATMGLVAFCFAGWFSTAMATANNPIVHSQVKRMHDRLIGVPPTDADLEAMETVLTNSGAAAAALWAIENSTRNKEFYNTTLKNFFVKYTNLEDSPLEPLNDAAALMIGMVKNDIPFDQVLYGNLLFVGSGVTAYSRTDNAHFEELEASGFDLSTLTQRAQSAAGGPVASIGGATPQYAGVLTTRAWGEAYYADGTNRRIMDSTVNKFLCRTLESMKDNTRVPDRIRQDVSRSPGGDSSIFLNHCVACHSGMDPLIAAFAYYEWQETAVDSGVFGLVYDDKIKHDPNAATPVKHKYLINAGSFPQGYVTVDDGWENYWREGKNAELGWGHVTLSQPGAQPPPPVPPSSAGFKAAGYTNTGNGPTSYGREFASTTAFGECQVNKVYQHVCLQEPTTEHLAQLNTIRANHFSNGNFNMKQVFAETAAICMGQ